MKMNKLSSLLSALLTLTLISSTLILMKSTPFQHLITSADPTSGVYVDPANVTDFGLTPKPTTVLRPDGDGTFDDWSYFGGGDYTDWDEADPHDGDSTYVWVDLDFAFQSSTLDDPPANTWAIAGVRVTIVARTTDADSDDKVHPILTIGGWDYWGFGYTPTTDYRKYTSEWAVNPDTELNWTWSDITSLEAGAVTEAVDSWTGQMRVTQVYVEVLGPRLTVNINVADVTDLWLYQFELLYNPDVLQGVYFNPEKKEPVGVGPFITKEPGTLGLRKVIPGVWNNTRGRLSPTGAWLQTSDPSKLPDGNGILSTVYFWVVGKGETEITLGEGTGLAGVPPPEPNPIPSTVAHGYFRNVALNQIPTASFTITAVDTPEPLRGYNTQFDGSGSTSPGGTITNYKWYFWRVFKERLLWPIVLDEVIVTQNYTSRGTWNVTLTVTDSAGVVGTTTGYVTIKSHDIFFLALETNATRGVYPTGPRAEIDSVVEVNATAVNQGDYSETFDVSTFSSFFYGGAYHRDILGTQTGVILSPGANTTLTFYWDTTGQNLTHPSTVEVHANASRVPYEWDTEMAIGKIADNEFIGEAHRIRFHDMAVTELALNATSVTAGQWVEIEVTVENEGDFNETSVDVTAYFDVTVIGTQTVPLFTNNTFGVPPRFPSHNYTTTLTFLWDTTSVPAGSYRIKVNVAEVAGEYETTDNTYISDVIQWPGVPIALFEYSPNKPLVGDTVTFNASASTPNGGDIVSYEWSFGDDSTDTGVTATHQYSEAGIYTVRLNITDSDGFKDIEEKTITISPVPIHDIAVENVTASPVEVDVGDSVTVKVAVSNEGNTKEAFELKVSYDTTQTNTRSVTLTSGATTTFTFMWDTSGVSLGNWTVMADAIVIGDEDPTDNTAQAQSPIHVIPEFPSFLVLPLFMILSLLAAIVYRRRRLQVQ